jgi:hypothetical protein
MMSRDLDEMFASLGSHTDARASLAAAAAVRRAGDRRITRNRLAVAAGMAAVAVAAAGTVVGWPRGDSAPEPLATNGGTVSPLPVFDPHAPIPAAAFLGAADDPRGEAPQVVTNGIELTACGHDALGGTDEIVQRKEMRYQFGGEDSTWAPTGVIEQVISNYADAGAARDYLATLRTNLTGCSEGNVRWEVPGVPILGDDSIVLDHIARLPVDGLNDPNGPKQDTHAYLFAIRIESSVAVLWATGWETGTALEVVEPFAVKAAGHLRDWRR